jgi:ribose transport system permease protein
MGRNFLLSVPKETGGQEADGRSAGKASRSALPRSFRSRELGVLFVLAGLIGAICLTPVRENFLSQANLGDLARQVGLLGIFAAGECMVIVTAGIDLSVGSLIGLSGVLCSILLVQLHWPLWAAFGVTVLLGLVIGSVHTFFISVFRIPPFVITLGSLDVLRSVAQLVTNSMPVSLRDEKNATLLISLGNDSWHGVPYPFLILIAVILCGELFMRKSAMGRYVYALGGNEEATRLSGVQPAKVRWLVYMASAGLASLAGIIYAGYITEGEPSMGVAYELDAIAAAVIGGCSLFGGEGTVLGTVLGAALLRVLVNAITFLVPRNSSLWEGVIVGCVVVIAVMFNELRNRSRSGRFKSLLSRFRRAPAAV